MVNQKKSYIFAFLAIILWSTVATAFKISLRSFDFIQLLFYATIVTIIILSIVLIAQNRFLELFRFSAKDYLKSAFLGFLNPFLYYMVLFKAYVLLPAQLAQPLNYTWPIMLVILSVPILKQKLTAKSIIAMIVSFSGVLFISMKGDFFNYSNVNLFGVFLAVGSSVIWALFWIFNLKDKREETVKLLLNFFFGLIFILPVLFIYSEFKIHDIKSYLSVGYVGFFEMGITFLLWLKAMKLSKSNDRISSFVFISPFLSLIFIYYFLKEDIYFTTIIGLILIILGIIVQKIRFLDKR
ncbi:MAG: DMT family transporter [Bacteroidota bacterium]